MSTDENTHESLGELTPEEKEQLRTLIGGNVDRLKSGLMCLAHELRVLVDAGEVVVASDEPESEPEEPSPAPDYTPLKPREHILPYPYKIGQSRSYAGVAEYEDCIAAYIVGMLALDGYLPPDFTENMDETWFIWSASRFYAACAPTGGRVM